MTFSGSYAGPSQPVASTVINFQGQQNPSPPRNPASSAGDSYGSPQAPVETPGNIDSYGSPRAPAQTAGDSYGSPSAPVQASYNGPSGNSFNGQTPLTSGNLNNGPLAPASGSYGSPSSSSAINSYNGPPASTGGLNPIPASNSFSQSSGDSYGSPSAPALSQSSDISR